jgi:hypothetical protein
MKETNMNVEEYEDLIRQLKRVSMSGREYYFWFCPKGQDGEPVLYVEKHQQVLKKRSLMARRLSMVKMFASGSVSVDAKRSLIFTISEGKIKSAKMLKAFKIQLSTKKELVKVRILLRNATVVEAS